MRISVKFGLLVLTSTVAGFGFDTFTIGPSRPKAPADNGGSGGSLVDSGQDLYLNPVNSPYGNNDNSYVRISGVPNYDAILPYSDDLAHKIIQPQADQFQFNQNQGQAGFSDQFQSNQGQAGFPNQIQGQGGFPNQFQPNQGQGGFPNQFQPNQGQGGFPNQFQPNQGQGGFPNQFQPNQGQGGFPNQIQPNQGQGGFPKQIQSNQGQGGFPNQFQPNQGQGFQNQFQQDQGQYFPIEQTTEKQWSFNDFNLLERMNPPPPPPPPPNKPQEDFASRVMARQENDWQNSLRKHPELANDRRQVGPNSGQVQSNQIHGFPNQFQPDQGQGFPNKQYNERQYSSDNFNPPPPQIGPWVDPGQRYLIEQTTEKQWSFNDFIGLERMNPPPPPPPSRNVPQGDFASRVMARQDRDWQNFLKKHPELADDRPKTRAKAPFRMDNPPLQLAPRKNWYLLSGNPNFRNSSPFLVMTALVLQNLIRHLHQL